LDVNSGSIKIDDQDIRHVAQDDLRNVISYVPQEPMLFHRTIRENIAYGKPDATEAEIISAAKRAHAHEFISNLKYGYDTMVGERGVKLSGGERQRIAIARVMLVDSPILILDEATSSLDSISEQYIQDAFSELMKGKTTIVIAHRLSTIQKMDRIIVLDKGN
jgi:ATP-binding cassette subfamily B protein